MVLKPGREAEAERIFKKWELDFAIIGRTTDTSRLIVRHKGAIVADMPVDALSEEAPLYERPFRRKAKPLPLNPKSIDSTRPVLPSLVQLLQSPDLGSRRWVWEQYDHSVMADTVQAPGGDAAVVRVHGKAKAIAITTDVTPRYCKADAFEGAKQAVAEAWRNLTAVGAVPLAVTDNLNFGNPERPEIMGDIVASIDGIGEACRVLAFPVVSGNCSLYNETNGEAILPTPAIGGVGLLRDVKRMATIAFKREGESIILVGETKGHLGQSLYVREIEGREEGTPPPVDLATEKRNGDFVRSLIEAGRIDTAHDVSDGGLLVALAEMAMANRMGVKLSLPDESVPVLYGEDQARYVITASEKHAAAILADAKVAGVPAQIIGSTGGDNLVLSGGERIAVSDLRTTHESWFPAYMGADPV
jgi:phosphoribosylformylglycinamidine synthase subunit PurL